VTAYCIQRFPELRHMPHPSGPHPFPLLSGVFQRQLGPALCVCCTAFPIRARTYGDWAASPRIDPQAPSPTVLAGICVSNQWGFFEKGKKRAVGASDGQALFEAPPWGGGLQHLARMGI